MIEFRLQSNVLDVLLAVKFEKLEYFLQLIRNVKFIMASVSRENREGKLGRARTAFSGQT